MLVDEGYVRKIEVIDTQPRRTLKVHLKYDAEGESVIHSIRRVSTPGRRVYRKRTELKPVIDGFGIAVVSTSKGVLFRPRLPRGQHWW